MEEERGAHSVMAAAVIRETSSDLPQSAACLLRGSLLDPEGDTHTERAAAGEDVLTRLV